MTPPGTALLTLGRMPKGLDIARALHGAGWRVLVADPFRWHLCRVSRAVERSFRVCPPNQDLARYLDDLAGIVRTQAVDLIVPVSEEAMFAVLLQPRLPAGVRMFCDDATKVRALHDKQAFNAQAAALGLAVPATQRLGSSGAQALADRQATIVKPVFSSAGSRIRLFERGATLPAADPTEPALVQERLMGAHRCTQSIAHQGRVLGTVVYRATITTGTVAGAFERIDAPDIDRWVDAFIAATNYSGFIAFDFIDDDEHRPCAIECNPRLTSGIHFFEPADLVVAMTAPEHVTTLRLRDERRLQQFYTSLTETQGAIFDRHRFRANLAAMLSSRDVTWQRDDPWPFLLMTPVSWPILSRAIFGRMSLGEAATLDIARLQMDQPAAITVVDLPS